MASPKTSTIGTPERSHTYTYWLTRDSENGVLDQYARIWLAKPTRYERENRGGWFWCAPGREEDLYGHWTLDQCVANAGTYPDDDRQCICRAGDSVRDPNDPTSRPA